MTTKNLVYSVTAADRHPDPSTASVPGKDLILVADPLITRMHTLVGHVRSDYPYLTNRQMALLLVVYLVDEQHTVRALASRLGVGKQIISRALDTLEMDYLRRQRGVHYRRDVYVERTPEGSAFLAAFAGGIDDPSRSQRTSAPAPQAA